VGNQDLDAARDKVLMGVERKSVAMSEKERATCAYHEAGHAVVAALLPDADPLHKVTIIPRGQALGSTMSLPKQDILNRRRKEMLDMIAMTMAGRIAEEIVSGDISTGASGDIQQATQLARAMVCHFGMSDKLGMVQYGDNNEYVFLGREMMRSKDYSERIAQDIDAEVKRIIDEGYKVAKDIIDTHRDKLEIIAQSLLEYETLDGTQVEEIVRSGTFTPPAPTPKSDPPSGAMAATPLPEIPKPSPPHLPGLGTPAPAAA
jgi:cell division protease FtsH